jgi:hypothetical protein
MKKMYLLMSVAALLLISACSNDKKEDKKSEQKMETPAKDTDASSMMAGEKEHSCTDKCKEGSHVYAHGEKGHTCAEECAGMKM